jgi:hypothetical protein
VIEMKTNRSIAILGQLLLYPHALRKALISLGVMPPPTIKARLHTTYLDENVYELANSLSAHGEIAISVCVGTALHPLSLVDPHSDLARKQVWDQSKIIGKHKLETVLNHLRNTVAH